MAVSSYLDNDYDVNLGGFDNGGDPNQFKTKDNISWDSVKGKANMGMLSDTVNYAGTGAGIGNMIVPGIGAAVGAGIGSLVGLAKGIWGKTKTKDELDYANSEIDKFNAEQLAAKARRDLIRTEYNNARRDSMESKINSENLNSYMSNLNNNEYDYA